MQLLLRLRNADTFGIAESEKHVSRALSIGRGKQSGWPLPDPTRLLSAVHCEIKAEKRGFTLTDFSRNGTRLNGEALVRMEPHAVESGDEIGIGPYLIAVCRDDGWDNPSDQKTIISRGRASAAIGDKTVVARTFAPSPATAEDIPTRAHKKSQNTAVGKPFSAPHADPASRRFVDAFCEGAALDPDSLAGRMDMEFARELGAVTRNIVAKMNEMSLVIGEMRAIVGSKEKGAAKHIEDGGQSFSAAQKRKQAERLLSLHFGNLRSHEAGADEALTAAIDDALHHNQALFFAMQTALFRLLNELSPTTIERDTRTGMIRSKSAKNWNSYVRKWEALNVGGEDGMLDVFLRYFGEAYDTKMEIL
jgi:type VI secretion system protein ImpI